MAVLFLVTFITGLAESHVHPGQSGIHTPLAIILFALGITHFSLNFKAFKKYLGLTDKKIAEK